MPACSFSTRPHEVESGTRRLDGVGSPPGGEVCIGEGELRRRRPMPEARPVCG